MIFCYFQPFVPQITDFAGLSVKDFGKALASAASDPSTPSTDRLIGAKAESRGQAFSYGRVPAQLPALLAHRPTDPLLSHPLLVPFGRLVVEIGSLLLTKASTGSLLPLETGRFGKWLDQLKDWNISRSRFWGTPLPIWRNKDDTSAHLYR